ncbi:MAG: peptide chain release factor N(5)-glutamine methyltransferase [candidate division Zixibacteria bacterium]|nr:peptide chain release factor N(5)-glutamine methyltransferase [candidate division Zixibacteria bacterium]
MSPSLAPYINEKTRILEAAGIEQAEAEVELILCHVLNVGRMELVLHGAERLTPDVRDRVDAIIERRVTRYPLQLILGEYWFYGRKFKVSPAVMVPAPETELLCEAAVAFVKRQRLASPRILDIGVGSGVISITAALEIPGATLVALDISPDAIAVAIENATMLGVRDRFEFRESDLFTALGNDERFDLILSNPPYISEGDYAGLPPEVLADPKVSLTSGEEGMDHIIEIVKHAPNYLMPGGRIMFEIGYDQSDKVTRLVTADSRYSEITVLKDLADIDRVVILACEAQ